MFFFLNPASVWFPCEVYKIHKSFIGHYPHWNSLRIMALNCLILALNTPYVLPAKSHQIGTWQQYRRQATWSSECSKPYLASKLETVYYIYIIIYICTYVQPSCTLDLARGRGPWPWPWPVAVARVRQLVFLWRSHDDVVLRGRKLGPLVPFGRDPALQGDTLEITISLDVAYGLYIYLWLL